MTLRVLSTPLASKGLPQAYMAGATANSWYAPHPRGAAAWSARAASIRSALVSSDWFTPLREALSPTGQAEQRLLAAADGGFVVTAGQQPGLFGGPLYTWWKALSAAAFADALQDATGLPVAPVFWAATDDSDFTEASSTIVSTSEGTQKLELPGRGDDGLPLSLVPLGDVSAQLAELRNAAGSAPHFAILEAIARAYTARETIGSAYVLLLRDILAPLGVSVIDASHPQVRQQGRALLELALDRAENVENALRSRDAELVAAGYSPQVQTVRGRTVVFATTDGRRARVATAHVKHIRGSEGAELSPNVLLRPILERTILPTVAYLGGPAEIAYFAQVTAVAAALETHAPLILPRWSGMVIEPRIQKILDRYSLQPEDFRDPHAVETRIAKASLPQSVVSSIGEMRNTLAEQAARLSAADESHLVSERVIEGLRRNVVHRVDRLERRYRAAVKRNGNEALREVAAARSSLYPVGVPQERALNGVPLMARYGDELFESVMPEVVAHARSLK